MSFLSLRKVCEDIARHMISLFAFDSQQEIYTSRPSTSILTARGLCVAQGRPNYCSCSTGGTTFQKLRCPMETCLSGNGLRFNQGGTQGLKLLGCYTFCFVVPLSRMHLIVLWLRMFPLSLRKFIKPLLLHAPNCTHNTQQVFLWQLCLYRCW